MQRAKPRFFIASLLLALLTGCSSLSTDTIQYLGVGRYEPSDWRQVAILHEAPERAHEKLGEVIASASLNPGPPVEKIETVLRQRAARLGADAIVLIRDRVESTGTWVTGPYWAPTISPIRDRVIVGVAIRYR